MNHQFWKNRKVLVTGAGSGIGKEIAFQLHQAGAHVIAISLHEYELDNLKRVIGENEGRLDTIAMDLTAPQAVPSLFNYLEEQKSTIEVLFNNAGTALYGPHIDLTTEKVNSMLTLNMLVMSEMAGLMVKHMTNKNVKGHIMNVASIAAFAAVPNLAAYSASKHYVLAFTHALSLEVASHGIFVGAICPGITRTPIIEAMGLDSKSTNKTSVSYFTAKVAMPVKPVALCALRAVESRHKVSLPGYNKLVPLGRLLPTGFVSGLLHRLVRKKQAA